MVDTIRWLNQRDLTERHEKRFLVTEEQACEIMRVVSCNLSPARHDCLFPWRTTAYCDTPDWRIYRSAVAGEAPTRLRFREYHLRCPSEVFSGEATWLELKDPSPSVPKRRVLIPCAAVPALLRGDAEFPTALNGAGGRAQRLLDAGARPVLVAQYSRLAYAAPGDRIRITADYNLSYLTIPWTTNEDGAIPCPLGPVIGRESGVVIEVKYSHELPHWAVTLSEFLRENSSGDRASKFTIGVRYLLDSQVPSSCRR